MAALCSILNFLFLTGIHTTGQGLRLYPATTHTRKRSVQLPALLPTAFPSQHDLS